MSHLKRLRQILKKTHLDAAFLSSQQNITYLTDYNGFSPLERDAYLLVTLNKAYLFTSLLYADEVPTTHELHLLVRTSQNPFIKQFQSIVEQEKIGSIGIEDANLTVQEYQELIEVPSISLYPLDIRTFRIQKSKDEITAIRKACQIGINALHRISSAITPGITEQKTAFLLETAIRKSGAACSFPTIVAFGKNSAIPHHRTNESKLQENDVVLIDFGVLYNSYCSDMTRTFSVGKAPSEFQKILSTVSQAQQKAEEFITGKLSEKEPVKGRDIDNVAREHIILSGYPPIPHSVGHGIGIEVHEAPSLSVFSKDSISEGMVFSIEPGIYLPDNFGVRIEDLYTIQNGKLDRLTAL